MSHMFNQRSAEKGLKWKYDEEHVVIWFNIPTINHIVLQGKQKKKKKSTSLDPMCETSFKLWDVMRESEQNTYLLLCPRGVQSSSS